MTSRGTAGVWSFHSHCVRYNLSCSSIFRWLFLVILLSLRTVKKLRMINTTFATVRKVEMAVSGLSLMSSIIEVAMLKTFVLIVITLQI